MKILSYKHLASHVLSPPLCKALYRAGSSAGSKLDLNERRSSNTRNEGFVSVMAAKFTDSLFQEHNNKTVFLLSNTEKKSLPACLSVPLARKL